MPGYARNGEIRLGYRRSQDGLRIHLDFIQCFLMLNPENEIRAALRLRGGRYDHARIILEFLNPRTQIGGRIFKLETREDSGLVGEECGPELRDQFFFGISLRPELRWLSNSLAVQAGRMARGVGLMPNRHKTHNAETRIMPHGLGRRPVALASAMRRFGIIMNAQKPLSKMNKTENLNSCVEPYVGSFAESFAALNYKETTIKTYKVLARRLGRLMDSSGISPSALTPDFADQLARTEVRGKDTAIRFHHFARRFAEHLIDIGVVQPVPLTKAQIARATLLADFQTYLIKQRGLRPRTIDTVSHSAERFLVHHFGNRMIDLKSLRAADTIGFVQHLLTNKPSHRHVAPASHLRTFFQYLFGRGETASNLALSLPKSAKCWDARLPRHLPPDGVEAVLASVRGNSRHGARDYAMLLLMARLGLRAVEVIAIQLDDIDWRSGELLVRGKGKLHDRVPITSEVGEALSRYLRDERGETSCRTAFVTHRAPHRPFKDSQIVNDILKDALATTGQKLVAPYVGSHLLRHSLATLLVNTGASIDEVGNVLRHRSRASTMKYVRLDIAGLRSISQAWPMSGGAQ